MQRILQNPVHASYATVSGERYPGRREPIIDVETWQKVQSLIQSRRALPNRSHTSRYLLSGLVYCGVCGSPMFGFRQPNRARNPEIRALRPYYEYYVCRNSTNFKGKSGTCENWGIRKVHGIHEPGAAEGDHKDLRQEGYDPAARNEKQGQRREGR